MLLIAAQENILLIYILLAVEQQKIENAEARKKVKSEAKLKEEKIILAKKMLYIKEPINKIIDFTGLIEKEIKKLKQ